MDVKESSILDLPLPVLDKIFARYSSGKAQNLALIASVCKTFSVPGRDVSILSINDSVENESKGIANFDETQFRLSRLIHLAPNATKVVSSVKVAPLTLSHWSRSVGRTLTSLEIPQLKPNLVEVLHTFSVLEELKVTVMCDVLGRYGSEDFQNFSKITNLELGIDKENWDCYGEGKKVDLNSFLKLFPNLLSLTVNSNSFVFIHTIAHLNVSILTLEVYLPSELEICCPNLQLLKLLSKRYGHGYKHLHRLQLKAWKFVTKVEIVEDRYTGEVEMEFEVGKESYEFNGLGFVSFDIMMRCISVKSLSIVALELVNLCEFQGKFWFPNLNRHSKSFNYSLDVPIELVGKLSSLSFKELRFTSKDQLDKDEMGIFENRYKMLKRLYPDIIFSCRHT